MSEEYESVTEREFREFIKNYPRKLTEHTVDFCSPPLTTYIDFEMGDMFTGIVAKEYWGTDKKDDLYYMPENERYYIRKQLK